MIRFAGTALAAFTLLALGCKSKLEKCQGVCTKMYDEDVAACGGDKTCLDDAADKRGSCDSLCDTAVGSGAARRDAAKKPTSAPEGTTETRASRCDVGKDAKACVEVAGLALKETPKNYPRVAQYLEKACDLGDMLGCELFGKAMRDGKGVDKDEKKARSLLDKACAGGAGGACTSTGIADDYKTAKGRALVQKGCDLDDAVGCALLGALYLHGTGVAKDLAKARTYLDKACKGGEAKACDKLAEIR